MNTVPLSSSVVDPPCTVTSRYNVRFKYVYSASGERCLIEQMFASRPVFRDASEPDFDPPTPKREIRNIASAADNIERAKRRARSKFTDYAYATPELDLFVTMTVGDFDLRYNPPFALKKLNSWLCNLVQRRNLIYLLVPELHKDGAIHFHMLANSPALDLVDSGTVCIPERKKPVRRSTAARISDTPPDLWNTVYNVQNWPFGFTTAIFLYGNRQAAISYVTKYITKTCQKIGGRYFYHGGSVRLPEIKLAFFSLDAFENIRLAFGTFSDDGTFRFSVAGVQYDVQRFALP